MKAVPKLLMHDEKHNEYMCVELNSPKEKYVVLSMKNYDYHFVIIYLE